MSRLARTLAWLALGAAVATPMAVRGDAIEARWFDERARAAFSHHRYEEALSLFLEVCRVSGSQGTLYNIGVSADLSGHPDMAYAFLEDFVHAGTGDTTRSQDAERRMRALEARLALVRVESDPPGATIWVDRHELGEWGRTPRTIAVEPGVHTIELTLDGHASDRAEVTSVRGETSRVTSALAERRGTLRVTVTPSDARVVATDARGAVLELHGEAEIAVGVYRLHIEREGYRAEEQTLVVHEDAPASVVTALIAIPPRTGRLLATTRGVRATLVVDGSPVSETPTTLDLVEGSHEVGLRADGFISWSGTIDVAADRSSFVDVTLVPRR